MTLWGTIVSWFYRDFPCGCRVARRWNGAWVCPTHLAKIMSGERVVLEHRRIGQLGANLKIRNVR